jgi:hypothetical protein
MFWLMMRWSWSLFALSFWVEGRESEWGKGGRGVIGGRCLMFLVRMRSGFSIDDGKEVWSMEYSKSALARGRRRGKGGKEGLGKQKKGLVVLFQRASKTS